MHNRLKKFQNDYERQRWGPVRIIKNWDLLLVEQGLALYLWRGHYPSYGYDLARDFCGHYDARFGTTLNGPSRERLVEIVEFVKAGDGINRAYESDTSYERDLL